MTPFISVGDPFRSQWDPFEISVFAGVAGSVISVLNGAKRHNPARQRLLPPLSKDKNVSSEFERLAGHQIVEAKLKSLEQFQTKLVTAASNFMADDTDDDYYDLTTMADGETPPKIELTITKTEVQPMLQALSAVRTYLAEILDIATDDDSDRIYELIYASNSPSNISGDDEPESEELQQRRFFASTYAAAGFVQETLLEAVTSQSGFGTQ